MSSITTNDNRIQQIPLQAARLEGDADYQLSEKDFRKKYVAGSQEQHDKDLALSGLDRSTSLLAFVQSTEESWRHYVPEFFMDVVLNTQIKIPNYVDEICPNTVTSPRDPFVYLGLETGDDKQKRPSWQFIAENASIDQTMQTYMRKEHKYREYGTAWAISRNLLNDVPLDLVAHRAMIAQAELTPFLTNYLTATLMEYTTGDFVTLYDNVYDCQGGQVAWKKANGDTETVQTGISVYDFVKAINKFRSPLTPDQQAIGRLVKGQNYYIPRLAILSPKAIMNLTLEVFGMGWRQLGESTMRTEAVQTALLSQIFGIPIYPIWAVQWTENEQQTAQDWEFIEDGYLVDNVHLGECGS